MNKKNGHSQTKNIIIGASGLIGGALYHNLLENNETVIGTYSNNCTIPNLVHFNLLCPDYNTLKKLISPNDNVYIMAANSNPSWISANRSDARMLNFEATVALIEALREKSPRIVFMSSVEVFDGSTGHYYESDKPNPLNLYGSLKYQVEEYLRTTYPESTIVRTGWNVGHDVRSRCVVKLTYETLLKQNAMMATDNYFSISDVVDTANALRLVGKYSKIRKIHICSSEVIRRDQLADLIIKTSVNGNKMKYKKCYFSDISYSEPRGRINNLSNEESRNILGILYKNARDIIIDKTRFIDRSI